MKKVIDSDRYFFVSLWCVPYLGRGAQAYFRQHLFMSTQDPKKIRKPRN